MDQRGGSSTGPSDLGSEFLPFFFFSFSRIRVHNCLSIAVKIGCGAGGSPMHQPQTLLGIFLFIYFVLFCSDSGLVRLRDPSPSRFHISADGAVSLLRNIRSQSDLAHCSLGLPAKIDGGLVSDDGIRR